MGTVEKTERLILYLNKTELIHGNVFTNDVKHSNAQLLGYKSFVKIVYTFSDSPFVMDDHAVKHRTNLT